VRLSRRSTRALRPPTSFFRRLYQHGVRQGLNEDITAPKNLAELLRVFFEYREPDHEEWDSAVAEFKERIPEIAERAKDLIDKEKKSNRSFRESFGGFYELCRQAINPNLSEEAVEKMLIQQPQARTPPHPIPGCQRLLHHPTQAKRRLEWATQFHCHHERERGESPAFE